MEIGNNHIHIFKTKEKLQHEVAESIVKQAVLGFRTNGRFTISLSGGSTPKSIYELLVTESFVHRMPWSKILFFFGDERFAPHEDEDSNYRMAHEAMFAHAPISIQNIFPIPTHENPSLSAMDYEDVLHAQFKSRPPSFDLILLGLGADGHTASIFPKTQVVQETNRWVREVYIRSQKKFRITLTAQVINAGVYRSFIVVGEQKAKALKEVLMGDYDPVTYPAQLIAQSGKHVHWYIDEAAAQYLESSSNPNPIVK